MADTSEAASAPVASPEPSEITVGGEQILEFNPEAYALARNTFEIHDRFMSPANFSFDDLQDGGGKGGDLIGFSKDGLFVVKECTGSDQATLLHLAPALVRRFCRKSLIARFYLHFRRVSTGRDFVVMNNWIPRSTKANWEQIYDLKGSADDKTMTYNSKKVPVVHKRVWNVNMWSKCCWTPERHEYYDGKMRAFNSKFHLTKEACDEILSKLRTDVDFMREQGLMDYSIIVGIQSAKYDPENPPQFVRGEGQQPWVCREGDTVFAWYIGVIDFLQEWVCGKKVAMCIKKPIAPQPQSTVPPDAYGQQFMSHFEQKFIGDAEHAEALILELSDLASASEIGLSLEPEAEVSNPLNTCILES